MRGGGFCSESKARISKGGRIRYGWGGEPFLSVVLHMLSGVVLCAIK